MPQQLAFKCEKVAFARGEAAMCRPVQDIFIVPVAVLMVTTAGLGA
jgi:hypothetical protein